MQRALLFAVVAGALGCSGKMEGVGLDTQYQCQMGVGCCTSPIVVDTAGDGVHLTGPDDGVVFAMHPGMERQWAWTQAGADDAWLALDVNGNGVIDDGSELFGDQSVQAPSDDPNGFLTLAYYDDPAHGGNGDGRIDAADTVWSGLRLWRDVDHDGTSTPAELVSLDDAGVHSFDTHATRNDYVDQNGNAFRFTSMIVADPPVSTTVNDVWLVEDTNLTPPPQVLFWTCVAWTYALNHDQTYYCDLPEVQGDVDFYPVNGRLTRRVARVGISSVSQLNALYAALGEVDQQLHRFADDGCVLGPFPNPDPYHSSAFDYDDGSHRAYCFATSTTGGGGC